MSSNVGVLYTGKDEVMRLMMMPRQLKYGRSTDHEEIGSFRIHKPCSVHPFANIYISSLSKKAYPSIWIGKPITRVLPKFLAPHALTSRYIQTPPPRFGIQYSSIFSSMDSEGKQGGVMRKRSFRYENYTNRRAFLRSYPLQWGADDESNRDMARVIDQHDQERPTKKIIQDDKYKKEDVQKVVDGRNQRRPVKMIIQDDKYNKEGWGKVVDGRNQRRPTKKIIRDDKCNKDVGKVADGRNQRRPVKKIILTVLHWGGDKVLFFRRFKHKLTLYAIVCVPAGLKTPNALLSA